MANSEFSIQEPVPEQLSFLSNDIGPCGYTVVLETQVKGPYCSDRQDVRIKAHQWVELYCLQSDILPFLLPIATPGG